MFYLLNGLPQKARYNTFLLDFDNKILAMGNPVTNPQIKELYKRIITNDSNNDLSDETSDSIARSLGAVRPIIPVSTAFSISNRDNTAYHIQEVILSCECISTSADDMIISPGDSTTITVFLSADSVSGQFCKYVDIFMKKKKRPTD